MLADPFDADNLDAFVKFHAGRSHFGEQHRDDFLRRTITEKLAECLFMPGNAVCLNQFQKILRRVARERRFAEMGIGRIVVRRPGIAIGEVAPSAARDADLFARRSRVVENDSTPPAFSGRNGRHHACGARAYDDHVGNFDQTSSAPLAKPRGVFNMAVL